MNIYIVYKFAHYKTLYPLIRQFENSNPKERIYYFIPNNEDQSEDWKEIADLKIHDSDIVLYLRKNESDIYTEDSLSNITYELSQAQKYNKKIIVVELATDMGTKNSGNEGLPSIIYTKDFLDNNCIKYKVIDSLDMGKIRAAIFDMNEKLYKQEGLYEDSFSSLLLQEYKIMLDTSEKMMDRRQGTNNFYITLCSAMLTVIVAFIAADTSTIIWSGMSCIISGMMMFLCFNWKKTLDAYGKSNEAKYEVLNKIEERLPAAIFSSEWEYGKIINYSSYSQREQKIPAVFFILFLMIFCSMAILGILAIK